MGEHENTWNSVSAERDRWFSMAFIGIGPKRYGRPISTTSLLLEVDIRAAFRAGAWLSVVVLSAAAVEAQFRHVYTEDYESRTVTLYGEDIDLHWLRELRNEILHSSKPGSGSSLWKVASNDLRAVHEALEPEAKRAVSIMFKTIYSQSAA